MQGLNAIIRQLDDALPPQGFRRHKHTWNRHADGLVDVIALQVSKGGDDVFVNVGVMDPAIYAACWLTDPPHHVADPECTVAQRLGLLMGDRDVWWPLDAAGSGAQIVAALNSYGLPFLERMHGPGALEQYLEASGVAVRPYPPDAIYLALLEHRRGEKAQALALLRDLLGGPSRAWGERVEAIIAALADADTPQDVPGHSHA